MYKIINKSKLFVIIILTLIISSFAVVNTILQEESVEIVGIWISEEDNNSKWVFTNDNKCKRYYENILLDTYNFSISNLSCGNELDNENNYLKLEKISDQKKYCYAINGIASDDEGTYLSLEYDGKPRPLIFKKQ